MERAAKNVEEMRGVEERRGVEEMRGFILVTKVFWAGRARGPRQPKKEKAQNILTPDGACRGQATKIPKAFSGRTFMERQLAQKNKINIYLGRK